MPELLSGPGQPPMMIGKPLWKVMMVSTPHPPITLLRNSVQVTGKLLAPPKGQIQNGTEDQALWNVESIQAPEAAAVIDVEVVPARGGGLRAN